MGLDITAYSHLRPDGEWRDSYYDEDAPRRVHVFAYAEFPRALDGIEGGDHVYETLHGNFRGDRAYEVTPESWVYDFRVGSYLTHGEFRRDLARFATGREPEDLWNDESVRKEWNLPFVDLILFADNEGVLGPEAAARLLHDLQSHRDRWYADERFTRWHDGGPDLYYDWTQAAEIASQEGAIVFH